jgi:hypothetical protein
MARIRSIKPDFFINDDLAELDPLTRLFYIGLWTQADREGRMEYRPKRLKAALLPYDGCEVETLVSALESSGFVERYEVEGTRYLQVSNFTKHQSPNVKECASTIPAPCQHDTSTSLIGEERKGEESSGRDAREEPPKLGNLPDCMTSDEWSANGGPFLSSAGHILRAIESKWGIVAPTKQGLISAAIRDTCPEGCKYESSVACAQLALDKIAKAHTPDTAAKFIRSDRGGSA